MTINAGTTNADHTGESLGSRGSVKAPAKKKLRFWDRFLEAFK